MAALLAVWAADTGSGMSGCSRRRPSDLQAEPAGADERLSAMKKLAATVVLAVVVAACGESDIGSPSSTTTAPPPPASTSPSSLPEIDQAIQLEAARARWESNRPARYSLTYALQCECDQGPWQVVVDGADTVEWRRLSAGPGEVPYRSVDAVFDEIGATLDEGRFPIEVEYHPELGYPVEYVFNPPELPVDGGFVLVVTSFEADPAPLATQDLEELAAARARWAAAAMLDYDYTLSRVCFCPPEALGPFRVRVRGGDVEGAEFGGEEVDLATNGSLVMTVERVFADIERALTDPEADVFADYHPELGYPTVASLDWIVQAVDDEEHLTLSDLVAVTLVD